MSAAPPPEQPDGRHRPGEAARPLPPPDVPARLAPADPAAPGPSGRRRRLIGAFARVVAEHGYLRTTVPLVIEAAGVPEQVFYAQFTDLEDCFLATYDHCCGVLLARMQAARRAEPGWRAGLRAALRVLLGAVAAEPAFARVAVIETGSGGPRVRRARLSTMANFRDLLSGPGMPPIPGTVRDALIGGIYTTIYSHIESDRTAELPGLLPAMSFFALLPFVSRDEAAEELLGH